VAPQTAVYNTFTLTNFGGLQFSVPNNGLKAIDFSEVSCTATTRVQAHWVTSAMPYRLLGSGMNAKQHWGRAASFDVHCSFGCALQFLVGGIATMSWNILQVVVDPSSPGGGHTVSFSGTLVPFFDGASSPFQANFSATISTGVQWIFWEQVQREHCQTPCALEHVQAIVQHGNCM
jgi:hypothetical protein